MSDTQTRKVMVTVKFTTTKDTDPCLREPLDIKSEITSWLEHLGADVKLVSVQTNEGEV